MDVPAEMTALVADGPSDGPVNAVAKLRVARVPVPKPGPKQVLVRIHAAPANPADLLYLEGRYGTVTHERPMPATPGFEGAGVVVASGGGMLARWMLGKRVACGDHSCSGTWAEYCLTEANRCMPLRKDLSFEQGATAMANPMTALALVGMIRRGKHKAYVQTGAAGSLGKMIVTIAAERGYDGIQIVRRAAQADALRALGAKHILISTDAGFEAALAAKCRELGASIAFDAVAGPGTGQLLNALAERGEVVVYGGLSGEACNGVDPMALAFSHKQIHGFELAGHLHDLGLFGAFRLGTAAQKRVSAGLSTTEVRARVALADGPAGLGDYVRSMTEGKVLLTPAPIVAALDRG